MSTRAQKRHHSDVEADDEVESENDEPVVRSDQHSKRSRTGTLPPLIRIDQIMRKKKLHVSDSNHKTSISSHNLSERFKHRILARPQIYSI
jgi:hypothetical protein